MHKKYNKFLIIALILVLVLGVSSYFYNDLVSEAATAADGEGDITSSLNSTVGNVAPVDTASAKVTEDTSFLMKLNSLTVIKVDTSLFEDQGFKLLKDNNIKLTPESYGRVNPFAPTSGRSVVSNVSTFTLKTIPATAITTKSAILNGSLDGAASTNIYFEYGLTKENLNKVTPKVTASLVGNFGSTVTGLSSNTEYFFRAVANINGNTTAGDIISFKTN
ncbi:hypothetical protein HXX01_00515 [Candidatus Nomurabacteria bacterium]|nr:hypothetical protein [Candidatus Nomurabacteria bacterium]